MPNSKYYTQKPTSDSDHKPHINEQPIRQKWCDARLENHPIVVHEIEVAITSLERGSEVLKDIANTLRNVIRLIDPLNPLKNDVRGRAKGTL